ncbi:GGDEF domain-containing response regulator [Stutzerimonas tarimensis]|uniref:Response regulator n=1 Tax=Stutzerimonas tarimensis TaxID=1507735 RepID=A0ABV7T2A0_9GAMM
MANPRLSILVVDDAKFSSAMIGRALTQAGYLDIRYADSAHDALAQLEQRPANVVLADWMMPEIDGLELTASIRQHDEAGEHYSYVILLTGREDQNALAQAFDQGVDDFISKSVMHEQLVPRVYAADRLCGTLQRLLQEKHRLTESLSDLEQRNQVDALTGLGNARHLQQQMANALRHVESREAALCYLLVGLPQTLQLRQQYGEALHQELQRNVARRLQQLVRPMDMLFRLDDSHFAVLMVLDDLSDCTPSAFKRLNENISHKAFKTSEGFINLKAGIALLCLDARALPTSPGHLMELARAQLPVAYGTGRIAPLRLMAPEPQ